MVKKHEQNSGPSYSLLALLKRTLYLHETAHIAELVEEIHEYMLKEVALPELKERYIAPILRTNPSFAAVADEASAWRLSEGNQVNDAIYAILRKCHTPLSERQILNRLIKGEQMSGKVNLTLNLKNDPRFADVEGGKYWILSEWVVINEYARSILLRVKTGLPEDELVARVIQEHRIDEARAIFIPLVDDRFVKQEKKWNLRRFVEQKTKIRASQLERLYQFLVKTGRPVAVDELTSIVLNLPANMTDAPEKLAADDRFVERDGKWDLQERLLDQEAAAAVRLVPEEPRLRREAATGEPATRLPYLDEDDRRAAGSLNWDDVVARTLAAEAKKSAAATDALTQALEAVEPAAWPSAAAAELPAQDEDAEVGMATPETEMLPAESVTAETDEELDEYIESLRNKVVAYLKDGFQTEGIVYNVDLIDRLVTSEERGELFKQFVFDHFVNPVKGRNLTHKDLIKFMVYLAEPTLNDKILDPCCGSGGFLLQILETLDASLQDAEWTERDFSIRYELRTGQFYFVQMTPDEREFFEEPLDEAVVRWLPMLRFCKQRQLSGMDSDHFAYQTADLNIALQGFPEIVLQEGNALTSKALGTGTYDLVIGNPPLTGDLATRFLRRSLSLIKPGGKILLLLPENLFQDFRLVGAALRHQLVSQTIVKAVIQLPDLGDARRYGTRQVLLYCMRKHYEAEQESDVFTGEITSLAELAEVLTVIEDPTAPVSQRDDTIDGDVVQYVLASYRGSAYNLLIEGLRRQVLRGQTMPIDAWSYLKKSDKAEPEDAAE